MTSNEMTTSYILSAIEPNLNGMSITVDEEEQSHDQKPKMNSSGQGTTNLISLNKSPDLERNLTVRLDDRDLWLKFQNLTNEMIVTKNGRLVEYLFDFTLCLTLTFWFQTNVSCS